MSSRVISAGLVGLGLAALLVIGLSSSGSPSRSIIDVSWPNCRARPNRLYQVGIIGVTGGLSFHANKCLNQETSWFLNYSLYLNSGYPGPKRRPRQQQTPLSCATIDTACRAYNYGYNSADYAINIADTANAHSTTWWIDVETDNSWSGDPAVNRALLRGMLAALSRHLFLTRVGFYSAADQWVEITANWQNDRPVWLTSGGLSLARAEALCHSSSFDGGPVWLAQYTAGFDRDLTCAKLPGFTLSPD